MIYSHINVAHPGGYAPEAPSFRWHGADFTPLPPVRLPQRLPQVDFRGGLIDAIPYAGRVVARPTSTARMYNQAPPVVPLTPNPNAGGLVNINEVLAQLQQQAQIMQVLQALRQSFGG